MSQRTEMLITGRLVKAFLDAGYNLGVNDGEDTTVKDCADYKTIIGAMCTTDHDYLLVYDNGKKIGWVMLVWGNDTDVISDLTVNLTHIVDPVSDWVESRF